MSTGKPPEHEIGAPGLAGGPGPSPPGVDDGTPHPSLGATPQSAEDPASQSAEEQGEEARIAERTAGTRRDQIPEPGARPGEPSPGKPASPRPPGAGEGGGREGRSPSRGTRRRGGEPEE